MAPGLQRERRCGKLAFAQRRYAATMAYASLLVGPLFGAVATSLELTRVAFAILLLAAVGSPR
jgi:hypothetical protein